MPADLRRILALMLISAASADGLIHPREEKIIRLGLGTDAYRAALEEYQAADEEARANMQDELASHLQDRHSKEKALNLLKQIFLSDGSYDPGEGQWMREVWKKIKG